ncbi:alpha-ketoglutarate-dependent dioxygenase AlkB [soil metagenome]
MEAPALPFQPSLLADGPTEPTAGFAAAVLTDLGRGAWIDHVPGWLRGADALFTSLLHSTSWSQRRVPMYGRMVDEPRLTAWWGAEEGSTGQSLSRAPGALRQVLPVLDRRYQRGFDAIGLNLYRTGQDSVAWHGDRFERERPVTTVAIVSLGSPRRFLLRPAGGGPSRAIEMFSGDLLVMGGTCQHTWEHCIPKVARAGPRMSATFRRRIHPDEA